MVSREGNEYTLSKVGELFYKITKYFTFINAYGLHILISGIQIRRYDLSEAQDGKSYCDAKIAHLRSKMRQYVASGNDIKSAADMKTAVDAFGGVKGGQTAHVEINGLKASEASNTKSTWKGITKISNLELR